MLDCGHTGFSPRMDLSASMIDRKALVIDDSKSARFALRRYLEGHRYQVEAVETADEAYQMLQSRPTGVIFLDHVMPGVDGFEVLRTLKQQASTAALPVVICSSSEGVEFNARARALGASAVLQKPPNPEELHHILEALERGEKPIDAAAARDDRPAEADPSCSPSMDLARTAPAPQAPASPLRDSAGVPAPVVDTSLREQLDQRLRKVSQGLMVQFAEIKATVAHLANQQARLAEQPAALRKELRGGLDESHQALRLVTSRIEGIEHEVFSQLTAMRTQLDTDLKSQNERLGEMMQFARQAAAEEAQVVAERTVMAAALRISDQLADAILGAVNRK